MTPILRTVRTFDVVAVILSLALTAAAAVAAYGGRLAATHVHIDAPDGSYVYDLGAEVVLEVDGPIGTTVIEIRDSGSRVVSSPCREQICVNAGVLDTAGDWTACLPNRIFLEVTGNETAETDAVSY